MKTMKKILSILLAAAMSLTLCVPAFATEDLASKEIAQVELDESVRNSIYEQLKEQGAENAIRAHEYVYYATDSSLGAALRGTDDEYTNVYAQYGGTLGYRTKYAGIKTDVSVVYLDHENSYYYLLTQGTFGVDDIILTILGYIPYVGTIASLISNAYAVFNSATYSAILDADGFAKITTIDNEGGPLTTVNGWTNHSYIYLYDPQATNIVVTLFPQYNPFED